VKHARYSTSPQLPLSGYKKFVLSELQTRYEAVNLKRDDDQRVYARSAVPFDFKDENRSNCRMRAIRRDEIRTLFQESAADQPRMANWEQRIVPRQDS
jgi:hypothetical protein